MKIIKKYSSFIDNRLYENYEEIMKNINFVNPELDYSEFFHLFNYYNNILPDSIDKSIFNKEKYYTELISENENESLQQKFNIKNALNIKSDIDKKWHNFIDYIYNIFRKGQKKEIDLNFLKNVYFGEDYKQNIQSFHNFIKNPKYLDKIKEKDIDLYNYYKKSFDWFDKNLDNIPIPVIIKIKDKYFLLGGNRRISWLLSKGIQSFPVWLIKEKDLKVKEELIDNEKKAKDVQMEVQKSKEKE